MVCSTSAEELTSDGDESLAETSTDEDIRRRRLRKKLRKKHKKEKKRRKKHHRRKSYSPSIVKEDGVYNISETSDCEYVQEKSKHVVGSHESTTNTEEGTTPDVSDDEMHSHKDMSYHQRYIGKGDSRTKEVVSRALPEGRNSANSTSHGSYSVKSKHKRSTSSKSESDNSKVSRETKNKEIYLNYKEKSNKIDNTDKYNVVGSKNKRKKVETIRELESVSSNKNGNKEKRKELTDEKYKSVVCKNRSEDMSYNKKQSCSVYSEKDDDSNVSAVHKLDLEPKFSTSDEILSIEDTNKLRSNLGLAPLKQNKLKKNEVIDSDLPGVLIPGSSNQERHLPADNIANKEAILKLREKLAQRREKRRQESKLLNVRGLASKDHSDDESAALWVKRQTSIIDEKANAAKRAKVLEDLEKEFGVDELVNENIEKDRNELYTKNDLCGVKVEHCLDRFIEGRSTILTLKDVDILDEENVDDTLVNVNILDDERTSKNLENIKKGVGVYKPYDDEGNGGILDKYDEEICGEKKSSFIIGAGGTTYMEEQSKEAIRNKLLKLGSETLNNSALRVASDYYTKEEIGFKKSKKKELKRKRKILKADDIIRLNDKTRNGDDVSFGSRTTNVHDQKSINSEICFGEPEDDERIVNSIKKIRHENFDIEAALQDRTAELAKDNALISSGAELIGTFTDDRFSVDKKIILNETSEFCRNLGAWSASQRAMDDVNSANEPTVSDQLLEFEASLKTTDSGGGGGWEEVTDIQSAPFTANKAAVTGVTRSAVILEEEPDLKMGVMGAILLAKKKGYLESHKKTVLSAGLNNLQAKNYTLDDKSASDSISDHRGGRYRDRSSSSNGPTMPFSEKLGYAPSINLEYIDDGGRLLNQKEAFRYLSHKFHGKGSGKIKTEKRQKKVLENNMMKNMSSTDTPLNTLDKLRKKQKEFATPYIVLTGSDKSSFPPTNVRK